MLKKSYSAEMFILKKRICSIDNIKKLILLEFVNESFSRQSQTTSEYHD